MIEQSHAIKALGNALEANPVAVLLGPRQCGKTTLAREIAGRRGRPSSISNGQRTRPGSGIPS